MSAEQDLDRIAINVRARKLLLRLLAENPTLEKILRNSHNATEALVGVRNWVLEELRDRPRVLEFAQAQEHSRDAFETLEWRDYAAIRILDYIDNAGREFADLNLRGEVAVTNPIQLMWLGVEKGTGGAKPEFYQDMLHLFRQFAGSGEPRPPTREQVARWMERFPSGLDPRVVALRRENRDRILEVIVDLLDRGEVTSERYRFESGLSRHDKMRVARTWWSDFRFHLRFAVRSPELLNEMLGRSLDPNTMDVLERAREAGIPFFVNPYYLSLLHVRVPYYAVGADLAIRDYIIYSSQLVNEFGYIVAWEKEDAVEPGKPNAAGWLLPTHHNVHRRYPDVAILIPDTMGRACGGLCASCQRMYDFQRGNLNFDLERLKPTERWPEKLSRLMDYFRNDSQLRDILITGGDALMSSDSSLEKILDAIVQMAAGKREDNRRRPGGAKFAEISRVRIGTRLPVYLPQRMTPKLAGILASFKEKASRVGIEQFIVQTHFESPMEVTPEARDAIAALTGAGWMVTNQLVFTSAASRRGHSAKLRRVLGDVGALPYYTFVVKGYMENNHSFTPIARLVQEELEEKTFGKVPGALHDAIARVPRDTANAAAACEGIRQEAGLPFLATDRSVLNLPGVGKSLTYRVIGITRYGRRILEFDHDRTRKHSPIIEKTGKVVVIESKSIGEYLRQLEEMGEDLSDYDGLYGYSVGQTEPRTPVYEYPAYDFEVTDEVSNLDLSEAVAPTSR
jgi:lysine 2,3-aminomutase